MNSQEIIFTLPLFGSITYVHTIKHVITYKLDIIVIILTNNNNYNINNKDYNLSHIIQRSIYSKNNHMMYIHITFKTNLT